MEYLIEEFAAIMVAASRTAVPAVKTSSTSTKSPSSGAPSCRLASDGPAGGGGTASMSRARDIDACARDDRDERSTMEG